MSSAVYDNYKIGNLVLKNRIVRSATYEGASDENGYPGAGYLSLYKTLAQNNVGMIITGFAFISRKGRAMQKAQAGIDTQEKIDKFRKVTDEVHKYNVPIIMQLAHAGRQTLSSATDTIPVSSCKKRSVYFRQTPALADNNDIEEIIVQFVNSACLAKESGFDGVQLHAAHGYLLHQFLLPETNILKNRYGIDAQSGLGTKLLEEVFDRIKEKCGDSFPVMIKISGSHDLSRNFYPGRFDQLIMFLNEKNFDAIEISYGTMDYALNIFRGELNLGLVFKHNPIFKTNSSIRKYFSELYLKTFISPKFIDFTPAYNLHFAERAKRLTSVPVISVGGFRSKNEIEHAIDNKLTDLIGLSRPLICEPDFVNKLLRSSDSYVSKCRNCNKCVFMCDSGKPTVCYSKG